MTPAVNRVIIAGSRGLGRADVDEAMRLSGFAPSAVVSGAARGVDKAGEDWAKSRGIPIVRFPADWNTYGKSAGCRRNMTMALNADSLVAVWDGSSNGTAHMINAARARKLHVYVHVVNEDASK